MRFRSSNSFILKKKIFAFLVCRLITLFYNLSQLDFTNFYVYLSVFTKIYSENNHFIFVINYKNKIIFLLKIFIFFDINEIIYLNNNCKINYDLVKLKMKKNKINNKKKLRRYNVVI